VLTERIQSGEQQIADEQSWSATFRLFNWYRTYDNGIWLDDGTGRQGIETIRRLQRHPWIVDPFDDGGKHDPLEERKYCEVPRERILEWNSEVNIYRDLREMSAP
jgi:hypothetical protein